MNERSYENLERVHPLLIRVLEESAKTVDFTVTEGVRSIERQKYLYAQGRTREGRIVTNVDGINKKSKHQLRADGYGYAVDLYANPINVNDTKRIAIVAAKIKETARKLGVSIVWGGDWRMKDYPHFELCG